MVELAIAVTERCREEAAARLNGAERKVLKNTSLEFSSALQLYVQNRMTMDVQTRRRMMDRLDQLNSQIEQIK